MFIAGGVVAVAIAAILFFSRSKEAPAPEPVVAVHMVKAERKPIRQTVTTEAILFPKKQAAVTPKITAPVRKFYVNRGSRVHAGELLAVLENRDLAAAVADSKGAFEQAVFGASAHVQHKFADGGAYARSCLFAGAIDSERQVLKREVASRIIGGIEPGFDGRVVRFVERRAPMRLFHSFTPAPPARSSGDSEKIMIED